MKLSIFILIFMSYQVYSNFNDNILLKIDSTKVECEQLVEILGNVIEKNGEIQEGIVNIMIDGLNTTIDVDCVIRGLSNANSKVVVSRISKSRAFHSVTQPDYFVYFEDFMQDKIMQWRGFHYTKILKPSTKFAIITRFKDNRMYKSLQRHHYGRIRNFFQLPLYVDVLIINIIGKQIEMLKLEQSFDDIIILENISYGDAFDKKLMTSKVLTIFHDNPPFSYRDENDRITGVEGNLMSEFCQKLGIDYEVINEDFGDFFQKLVSLHFDMSLYRRVSQSNPITHDSILINDIGSQQCVLVPRNIPVYARFSSPYSYVVNTCFIISLISVGVVWKIFKRLQRQNLSFSDVNLEMLKALLQLGIDDNGWSRWTLKEKILLVPFIFMIIVLMGIYESYIVSEIITEHPMRSVGSIQELNESSTKIYEYFKEAERFGPEKVVHFLNFEDMPTAMSKIPENFDLNLAYFVRCRFAEEFLNSKKNFDGNRQLFDILYDHSIENHFSTYLVNENFPLKKQFKRTVQALDESGIINYWTENIIRETFSKFVRQEEEELVQLGAMVVPLMIAVIGMIVSMGVFAAEIVYYKWKWRRSTRVIDLRMERLKKQKRKGAREEIKQIVRKWRSHSI